MKLQVELNQDGNQEGAVLSWPDRGIFVKVKTAWYVGEHGTWKIPSNQSHGMLKSNGRLGNEKHCSQILTQMLFHQGSSCIMS